MKRIVTAVCGASLAACIMAGPAAAAGGNIAYVKNDKIWTTSPDGADQRQITTDELTYGAPSQKDDGTIVVAHPRGKDFYLFNLDGARTGIVTPENPSLGCGSVGPLDGQVEPQGNRIVYWYLYDPCGSGSDPTETVAFSHANQNTRWDEWREAGLYENPRWLPGADKAIGVRFNGEDLAVIDPYDRLADPQPFVGPDDGEDYASFDVARNGRDFLVVTHAEGVTGGPGGLELWHNDAQPPALGGSTVCDIPAFGSWSSTPSWSPDGTAFTWADDQGVWVSPAPTAGNCTLAPKLIAPGGSHPDWGAKDLPAKAGPAPTPTPGPTTGDTTAPTVSASVGRTQLAAALAKGLPVTVNSNEAGSATVEAVVSSRDAKGLKVAATKVAARGKKALPAAGKHKVVVKFTKKAKRKFRRHRKLKLTLRVTVADAAGNKGAALRKVTLKR